MSDNLDKSDGKRFELKADEIECVTTPLEAETMLVDAVRGVAVLNDNVRISFVEHVLDTSADGAMKARHVVTLATSVSSLGGFLELLNKVYAQTKSPSNDG